MKVQKYTSGDDFLLLWVCIQIKVSLHKLYTNSRPCILGYLNIL